MGFRVCALAACKAFVRLTPVVIKQEILFNLLFVDQSLEVSISGTEYFGSNE